MFIERLLKGASVAAGDILATDVRPERMEELRNRLGNRVSPINGEGVKLGGIVFLGVPPNVVKAVLTEVREQLRPHALVVSLAAAIPTRSSRKLSEDQSECSG